MKIMLMDQVKLVNLVLPREVFGNYWVINADKDNLVNVEAIDGNWILKSNSEIKVFKDGTPVNEIALEEEKFYTLKNVLLGQSYVIYTSPTYDKNTMQLCIGNIDNAVYYIGNNNAPANGNVAQNIISYEQNGFARNQIKITVQNGLYSVINLNPQMPMYINGLLKTQDYLKYGDSIFILGFKLSIVKDIFMVNNPNKLLKYDAKTFITRSLPVLDFNKISKEVDPAIEMYKKEDYFLKPPRFDEKIEEKELIIDPPPAPQKQEEMPAILTMGSMIMMGMSSVMNAVTTLTGVLNGTVELKTAWPSLLTCLAMLTCMLVLPTATKMYNKHKKKVYERRRQATYRDYVERKRVEFLTEMKRQQQILIEKYIPLKEVGDVILFKKRTLWEKNMDDYDFLSLRLGIGSIPPFFHINFPDDHFSMDAEDNLMGLLRQLEKETEYLVNVPVTYSFTKKFVTGIIGKRDVTNPFIRGLLLQMFAYHGYDDLKVCVFTSSENSKFWEEIQNCPYFWDDNKTLRFFGTNIDDINHISSYLEELLAQVREANESNAGTEKRIAKLPKRFVIMIDDIDLVRNVSIIRTVLESTEYLGISLIICTEKLNSLPNEVEHFISVDERSGGIFERVLTDGKRINFTPDFMFASLEKYVYVISNIPIALNGGKYVLPSTYTFLEMYNVSNVNQLNCLSRWKDNDPINSLAAPVGVNEYGELFNLDLHEKAHGPHGLIAGMTGSGKSEFIISFILSMAVNFHPNEVQFVLIDYKGGGLAGAFENRETGLKLPHLAGTITNLDVNGINRSLASLQSELKRRQAEFNKARDAVGESTIDIYKYQRLYRSGKVKDPIAHLFIISDEFAELKAQQPDFMDELISTARIGRSLGVHLILATQKPSGVVNDQIWSNSKFKICLKVQDRSDSQEMIKRPDAASLKETGRFFLQVGYDEFFALGQSAWTGAPYYESDVRKKKVDNTISFVNNLGAPIKVMDDGKQSFTGVLKGEELPNIMKYMVDLSKKENIQVKQLWLNALPPIIYIDGLKEKYEYKKIDCDINPVIGEYDAPDLQKQGLLTMPITQGGNWIIYGIADSGKDEVVNSIVYSCITTYSPVELQMYLMDFGAETLRMYRKAPQVGDVVFQQDADKVTNLIRMISSIMEQRRKLFADYGGNYINYCKTSGKVLPNIVVILNGYETFSENYGDSTFDSLITITRDCQKYGIYFIMTCASVNGIRSKLAQYLPNHLVLQMNDKYDYSTLLSRTKLEPAAFSGRGLVKLDTVYEFQAAVPVQQEELNTVVSAKIKELCEKYKTSAPKIPVLPEIVTISYCADNNKGLQGMPVGVEKESLAIRTLNFTKNLEHTITALEFDTLVPFGKMFIKQIGKSLGKNVYVFDPDKYFGDIAADVSYYDSNVPNCYKQLVEFINKMYDEFAAGGYDPAAISKYGEYVCVIAGIDKFKMLLGNDFSSQFADLLVKIKAMPKMYFIIMDEVDNIKKFEYDTWYKAVVSPTRGIWVGEGMSTQFTLKSTLSARQLSAKIDNTFGYYVDGSVTVLVKLITDVGEEDQYESL
ncbi:MAG: type VII secretion protein EssC [Candidatus Coprovivens sp.]